MLKGERPSVRILRPATLLVCLLIASVAAGQPSTFTGQFGAFAPPPTMAFDQVTAGLAGERPSEQLNSPIR